MKLQLIAVGRIRGVLTNVVVEYEQRIGRYFAFEALEVREETAHRASPEDRIRNEEGKRLLGRVRSGLEIVALTREGRSWSSRDLADYLDHLAVRGRPGAAFLIGGAYGLATEVLRKADHQLSLSAMTMPHELARVVIAEQLYRAGTITRGEPYHKSR